MNIEPLIAFFFGLGVFEIIIIAVIGMALSTGLVATVVYLFVRRQ